MKNRIWAFGKVELGFEPRALSLADIRHTTIEVWFRPAPSFLDTVMNMLRSKGLEVPRTVSEFVYVVKHALTPGGTVLYARPISFDLHHSPASPHGTAFAPFNRTWD